MAETVWKFETKRFRVALEIDQERGYRYDGDDRGGKIQAKLDSGEYVAFQSALLVYFDGSEIAADYLGGSVYSLGTIADFWTAHRDRDANNRNCSLNDRNIGHYFPDMVRTAIDEAREYLARHGVEGIRSR